MTYSSQPGSAGKNCAGKRKSVPANGTRGASNPGELISCAVRSRNRHASDAPLHCKFSECGHMREVGLGCCLDKVWAVSVFVFARATQPLPDHKTCVSRCTFAQLIRWRKAVISI